MDKKSCSVVDTSNNKYTKSMVEMLESLYFIPVHGSVSPSKYSYKSTDGHGRSTVDFFLVPREYTEDGTVVSIGHSFSDYDKLDEPQEDLKGIMRSYG